MIINDYAVGKESEKMSASRHAVLRLKSEVLLRQIAKGDHYNGGQHF